MSLTNDNLNKAALARINAGAAMNHLYNKGSSVRVGIVSDGLALHTAYKNQIRGGWDFVANQAPTGATDGSTGTLTAGLIAGSGVPFKASVTNGPLDIGILGVAPEVHLYDLKVEDSGGASSTRVTDAINWAVNNNLEVLVLQVGFSTTKQDISDAIDAAYAAGITMIAPVGSPAGYYYPGSIDDWKGAFKASFPASHSKVIGVAEIDHVDDTPDYWRTWWDIGWQRLRTVRWYHARDGSVDLVASGGNSPAFTSGVGSTSGTDSTTRPVGTHVAAAMIAGVAALVIRGAWATTVDGIKQRLLDSATALSSSGLGPTFNQAIYGSGLVNAVVAAPPHVSPQALAAADIKTLLGVGADGLADPSLVLKYSKTTFGEFQEIWLKPPDSSDESAYLDADLIIRLMDLVRVDRKPDPLPYLGRYPTPWNGDTNIPVSNPIRFTLLSDTIGNDINSVKVKVSINGGAATTYTAADSEFSYTGDRMTYYIEVKPQVPFGYEDSINVEVEAQDLAGKPGLILERIVT